MDKKNIKNTQTEKNLNTAFAGESMARNKYTYFASVAKKAGYVQIQKIFEETAANEKEHAELWFKALHGGSMPDLLVCLDMAASGEEYEFNTMYKEFAITAKKEGFDQLANLFEGVRNIEKTHGQRYRDLIQRVKKDYYKRDAKVLWQCQNCGHLHLGPEAPKQCPVCSHPQSYFQENPCKNY